MFTHPIAFRAWSYSIEIETDYTIVAGSLTGYKLYKDMSGITDQTFWDRIAVGGVDLRASFLGSEIPIDIVAISRSGQTGQIHLRMPTISSIANDIVKLYVGNTDATLPLASDPNGSEAVWSDENAVHHMNEDPSGSSPQILDSTENDNHGTSFGSMVSGDSVAGKLGGANCLEFNGVDQYIMSTGNASTRLLGDVTLSCWTRYTSWTNAAFNIIFVGYDENTHEADNDIYHIAFATAAPGDVALGHEYDIGVNQYVTLNTNLSVDTWYYLVAVRDATAKTWKIYINGVLFGTTYTYTTNATGGGDGDYFLGGRDNTFPVRSVTGKQDESRTSALVHTVERILTQYENQNSSGDFSTSGNGKENWITDVITI